MDTIAKLDREIETLARKLTEEYRSFFTSDERKSQIVEDLAKLRASMSPQCNCKDKD